MPRRLPQIYDLDPDALTTALRDLADAIDEREVDVKALTTTDDVMGDAPYEQELTLTYIPTTPESAGIIEDAFEVDWEGPGALGVPDLAGDEAVDVGDADLRDGRGGGRE